MIEKKQNRNQCSTIATRIIDRFHHACAGGTQFGCDWPTMRAIFPRSCRVFYRLARRFKEATA